MAGMGDTFEQRWPFQDWTVPDNAKAIDTPPDPNELAAARLARPYARANQARQGQNPLPEFAESLAPQEPWQWALMFGAPGMGLAGQAIARTMSPLARMGAAAAGFTLAPPGTSINQAQGAGLKLPKGVLRETGEVGSAVAAPAIREWTAPAVESWLPTQFLKDPQRVYAPGIYQSPRAIAEQAAARTAPEHPAMKYLFGVTRDDLWQIGGQGARPGNVDPSSMIQTKTGKGGGSYVSENVMTPANAQRMIDTSAEARKFPQLSRGMEAWYVMDPAFDEMVKLVGYQKAVEDYRRFNAIMTPFSSNSTVEKEINRGTAARMMADRGEWNKFVRYGGMPVEERPRGFPKIMQDVDPHLRHNTQYPPVERWLATGSHGFSDSTIKNPLYSLALGVPATGFQTRLPVPDAHLARGAGAADVRTTADPGAYMTLPEYRDFGPWYRENVARPLGIEAVPAQALQWGVMGPQTGVKTLLGAPKLEILSQKIWNRAQQLGVEPKALRDAVLQGKNHAACLIGAPLGAGVMGGVADQSNYNYR